ncbi:lytic murein transglycosylase [Croceicoccus estronivorus]|uniref:lytic transglycosylase domain-containing protein n=1 Tax=Croceicoccus estronivorus TaxID=1172626 RepID=UPI0008323BC7|nr:lytic transglycosylase domain-containing protein [Croceicoccus estronivorus]OCC23143.1 lytic murein transglycosylase [Croceicoccus estronivorus]
MDGFTAVKLMRELLNAKLLSATLVAGFVAFAPYAAEARSSAEYFSARATTNQVPSVLSRREQEYYRSVFDAIRGEDWTRVQDLLAKDDDGPLHEVAMAEYYLAANSPKIELPLIQAWLADDTARDLPQAAQMSRLGLRRGLEFAPSLPQEQTFYSQGSQPKRIRPRSVDDGTMPASISSAILERIKNDDPDGARQLLDGIDSSLSSAARAEWRQRVAWSYYIENDDPAALAMALRVSEGSGDWVAEGDWVAGLASWRLGDCETAASRFEKTARRASNPELGAAGYYWASRAQIRCRAPEKAASLLRSAAKADDTLYGMLALEQLGQQVPSTYAQADFSSDDWKALRDIPNVRIAAGLVEIGEYDLADEVLRHQAKIGDPRQFDALSRLARDFGMPATQLWMAYNAPRGGNPEPASRFPTPKWQPSTGWRVDPALVYAHALQESNFRTSVVSPAGARGLMQIMPGTAQHYAASINMNGTYAELAKPEINLAFGQRTLEALRDSSGTGGLLPKVMAAYNAGLSPVTRWNTEIRDQGDPLLWMESIPYWETRGYVAIVTRNYWMYERQANADSPSRVALAQDRWPLFPGVSDGGRTYLAASDTPDNGY